MDLTFSAEQQLLRDTCARLFASESSPARVRAAEASGFDAGLWQHVVELGINLLRTPAAQGGSDMGLLEAALVAEEAGRHLASIP